MRFHNRTRLHRIHTLHGPSGIEDIVPRSGRVPALAYLGFKREAEEPRERREGIMAMEC